MSFNLAAVGGSSSSRRPGLLIVYSVLCRLETVENNLVNYCGPQVGVGKWCEHSGVSNSLIY